MTVVPDTTVAWKRIRPNGPQAYCPICGNEIHGTAKITTVADALCPGRCKTAWTTLEMLRDTPHANKLSELLLAAWRAGDWRIEPETILAQLPEATAPDTQPG